MNTHGRHAYPRSARASLPRPHCPCPGQKRSPAAKPDPFPPLVSTYTSLYPRSQWLPCCLPSRSYVIRPSSRVTDSLRKGERPASTSPLLRPPNRSPARFQLVTSLLLRVDILRVDHAFVLGLVIGSSRAGTSTVRRWDTVAASLRLIQRLCQLVARRRQPLTRRVQLGRTRVAGQRALGIRKRRLYVALVCSLHLVATLTQHLLNVVDHGVELVACL